MVRLIALALLLAGGAEARGFAGCTKAEEELAGAAVDGAIGLVTRAGAAVGDTDRFVLWFGAFSPAHGERVRATLKVIHQELAADRLRVDCEDGKDRTCWTAVAYVTPGQSGVVNLCPSFFEMPSFAEAAAGGVDFEIGTREGVLVHELSHFPHAGGTGDECYARTTCQGLARRDPATAVDTADSYQYFAEDVTMGAP